MTTTEQQFDPFEVLGASEEASEDVIKRAYYKLVRLHPPETDPEGYKKIQRAYDLLSDPETRRSIIEQRKYPEIQTLINSASEEMDSGNFQAAGRLCKRVLALSPQNVLARQLLAQCQIEMKEFTEAELSAKYLISLNLNNEHFHLLLGNIYKLQSEDLPEGNRKNQLVNQAREAYKRVIEINPINVTPYLAISDTYINERKFDAAIEWAEKAVSADSVTDFWDFDALFLICQIHAIAGNYFRMPEVVSRIEGLINNNDNDQVKYVAARFAQMAIELLKLKVYEPAHHFMQSALRFEPYDEDLNRIADLVKRVFEADKVWMSFKEDYQIIEPVKTLAALYFMDLAGEQLDMPFETAFKNVVSHFDAHTPQAVHNSVKRMKDRYRAIFNLRPEAFEDLLELSNPKSYESSGKSGYTGNAAGKGTTSNQSTGGCASAGGCILGIIGGAIGSAILPCVGTVIGAYVGWYIGTAIGASMDKS